VKQEDQRQYPPGDLVAERCDSGHGQRHADTSCWIQASPARSFLVNSVRRMILSLRNSIARNLSRRQYVSSSFFRVFAGGLWDTGNIEKFAEKNADQQNPTPFMDLAVQKVVVTDWTFPDLSIEEEILSRNNVYLAGKQCKNG